MQRSPENLDEADGILIVDASWVCLFVDDSACRVMHTTPTDLVGRNLWEACPSLVGSSVDEQYRRALAQQEFVAFDAHFPGQDVWRSVRVFPSNDGLTIYCSDGSQHRGYDGEHDASLALAARLASEERRYHNVLDALAEGVLETTVAGEVISVNLAFAEMLGYDSPEELMDSGHTVDAHTTTAQRSVDAQQVTDPTAPPGSTAHDLAFRMKDGTTIWVRARSTAQRSPSGRVLRIQTICENVSTARWTRQRLAAVVDESHDAIFTSTLDGTMTSWNGAAEDLFGFTADEIIGQSAALIAPPGRAVEQAQMRDRLVAGGPSEQIETIRCRKDGSLVDVFMVASALSDDDGAVAGFSVIAHDLTDQRAARLALEVSEHHLSEAQRIAHIGSFSFQLLDRVVTWSAEFSRILGLDPATTPSIELFISMVHPDDRSTVERAWKAAAQHGLPFDLEVSIVTVHGDDRFVCIRAVAERTMGGAVAVVAGTMRDDTHLATADRALRAAEARFDIGFEQAAIGAVISDLDGAPRRVNPAVCSLLGRCEEELIGRSWAEYGHPDDLPLSPAALVRAAVGQDTNQDERRFFKPDGTMVWAAAHVSLVRDAEGDPQYFFTQLQDVTDRKRMEADLVHQSLHDATTGLANEILLTDRLLHSLARAGRLGTQVAVLFIGLDHFMLVNEAMGRSVGDELLRSVGERISAAIRPGDTVVRAGGDEFVIVADDVSIYDANAIAEKVLLAVRQPCVIADHELNVTASIGFAIASDDATPESMLRDSHSAMSFVKEHGRGRAELYGDARYHDAKERLKMNAALHHALERREFRLYYQPVFDLATGDIVAAEALLRWEHPTGALVDPAEFIPIAEQTGLIVPIGAWVVGEACRQLAQWQQTNPSMSVAINLSVRQALNADIVGVVDTALSSTGVRPDRVCLELTESLFMSDSEQLSRVLDRLKGLGVRLSIDDFGTGYSSLSRLRALPIDEVKIDQAFMEELGTDPHGDALVAAMIAMAAALDVSVTAEGVETPEQLAVLEELRCERVQGFLLAHPMPASAMDEFLADIGRRRLTAAPT